MATLTAARPSQSVEILSESDMPEVQVAPVMLNYRRAGNYFRTPINARRPTYFDKLIAVLVHERRAYRSAPLPALDSYGHLLRFGYRAARGALSRVAPAATFKTPVLDLRTEEPNNVAHLLLNLIPYCLHSRKTLKCEPIFLFTRVAPRFRPLLEIFGVSPTEEPRRVDAPVIKLRGARGLAVYDLLGTFDCEGINFFPDTYSSRHFDSLRFERVFFARRGVRRLRNHEEIERLAEEYGYRTLYAEDYSLHDQLSIGAHARHVLAIHGAAMSLLLMSEHIDSVIELLPDHNYNAVFPVCLAPRVSHSEQIISEFDESVVHSGWGAIVRHKNAPFAVDVALLRSRLTAIHEGGRRTDPPVPSVEPCAPRPAN
jgi:hypothetical protein